MAGWHTALSCPRAIKVVWGALKSTVVGVEQLDTTTGTDFSGTYKHYRGARQVQHLAKLPNTRGPHVAPCHCKQRVRVCTVPHHMRSEGDQAILPGRIIDAFCDFSCRCEGAKVRDPNGST